MKKNKPLRITAFDLNGKKIKSFKTLHRFLKYSNSKRLDNGTLFRLRQGKIIYVNGFLLGLISKIGYPPYINPLNCSALERNYNAIKHNNINIIYDTIYNRAHEIIIIDNTYKVIGTHCGSMESLSRKRNVPVGTIKSSLSRTPWRIKDTRREYIYFIYLKDIPLFLCNVRKHYKL